MVLSPKLLISTQNVWSCWMLTSKGGRSSLFALVPKVSKVYSSGILSNRKYQVAEIIMVLPVL